MSNKVYNVLKYIALIALPAFTALYASLAEIWGLPYATQVTATLAAIDAFLGVILGISSVQYNKKQ